MLPLLENLLCSTVFSLSKPRKAQKLGELQSISLERVDDPLICPFECLGYYVYRTDFIRSDINQNLLVVGLKKLHREVSGSTVGRWVKGFLWPVLIQIFSLLILREALPLQKLPRSVCPLILFSLPQIGPDLLRFPNIIIGTFIHLGWRPLFLIVNWL